MHNVKRLTYRDKNGYCHIPFEVNCVNGSYDIENEEYLELQIERLCLIEDILGDNYDLDHLRRLIEADKKSKNDDYWPFQK